MVIPNLKFILLFIELLLELINQNLLLRHLVVNILNTVFKGRNLTVFSSHLSAELLTLLSNVASFSKRLSLLLLKLSLGSVLTAS